MNVNVTATTKNARLKIYKKQDLVGEGKSLQSFQRLNFYYVCLISFVKEEQFRRDFYNNYLSGKNIITNTNNNLVNSSSISVSY